MPADTAATARKRKSEALKTLKELNVITTVNEGKSMRTLSDALMAYATNGRKGQQQLTSAPTEKRLLKALAVIMADFAKDPTELVKECIREEMETTYERMRDMVKEKMEEIKVSTDGTRASMEGIAREVHNSTDPSANDLRPSYSSVVASKTLPANSNPTLYARRAIQGRQIVLKLDGTSEIMGLDKDLHEIKAIVQKTIVTLDGADTAGKVRSVVRDLKKAELMIELETNEVAAWLKREGRAEALAGQLGASVKERRYPVVAQFVPITYDPERDIPEMEETNHIQEGQILKARWIKPISRRSEHQRAAHLIIEFKSAEAANDVMVRGIRIHGAHLNVEKCRREPIRCLKCHRWGHIAKDCRSETDTCGTCGDGGHRTSECKHEQLKRRCISCNTEGHASWDRGCPTFRRKCAELNKRDIENALPYYPTTESWTWLPDPIDYRQLQTSIPVGHRKQDTQRGRKDEAKERRRNTTRESGGETAEQARTHSSDGGKGQPIGRSGSWGDSWPQEDPNSSPTPEERNTTGTSNPPPPSL
jgi:hypothetical protein